MFDLGLSPDSQTIRGPVGVYTENKQIWNKFKQVTPYCILSFFWVAWLAVFPSLLIQYVLTFCLLAGGLRFRFLFPILLLSQLLLGFIWCKASSFHNEYVFIVLPGMQKCVKHDHCPGAHSQEGEAYKTTNFNTEGMKKYKVIISYVLRQRDQGKQHGSHRLHLGLEEREEFHQVKGENMFFPS